MKKTGLAVSSIGHALLLAWGLITFSAKPFEAKPVESMPIDLVSVKEFTELKAGTKKPKVETPKPVAEKVDKPKPVEEPVRKVEKKPEIKTETPPPKPEPRPEPEKKVEKPEPKPEKKVEHKPEPKVDQIAEALKKDEAKKVEKKIEKKVEKKVEKKPEPKHVAKRPPQPHRDFNAERIAALLDKREPRREEATAETINPNASLGTVRGKTEHLSLSELDALRQRLMQLWNPPVGAKNPEQLIVQVRLQLRRDGTLAGPPQVLSSGQDPLYMAARDSAIRAIFRGQPYTMLPADKYDIWKDVEITFDPRDMFPG